MRVFQASGPALLAFCLCACTTLEGRTPWPGEKATLIYNGSIYVDPARPPVEALVVLGKRVARVGRERELRQGLGQDYRALDLRGGVAVPGLTDAHGHIAGLGEALESVSLQGAASYEEVIERVRSEARHHAPGTWITGRGWDQSLWEVADFPHHEPLSEAVPDHPVLIRRVDGHAALANARALGIAGLLFEGPPPQIEGGRVEVDGRGVPTGLLIDTAMGLVGRHVPAADGGAIRRRILRAQEALLELGVVCVHDMGIDPATASILEELDGEGRLELRVVAYLWANSGLDGETLERYPRPEDASPEGHLRIVGAKLMLDGALGSRGAALLDDYTDAPGERGLMRMEHEAFVSRVRTLSRAGLQPATHAIGDRANRMLLDAYAELNGSEADFAGLRPRIEHAQVVAPGDWDRFGSLGVVASMQPTHATSDMRWAEARLGAERLKGAYAWRRLVADPGTLAFGSDFPVESPDPLEGLYAARTRMDGEGRPAGGWLADQALSGAEALAAFTAGPAFAAHEETARGTLAVGFFADLTVLDIDPVLCDPEDLLEATVLLTIIDGEVVFQRTSPE